MLEILGVLASILKPMIWGLVFAEIYLDELEKMDSSE
jgi:hypothetical protein|tara:strand:+ start:2793 stop:2903 length:111 start_codon:yes stop_codon:yes gene_type:complete